MSKPVILVDGDGLLYRCGFAVEKTRYLIEHGKGHFIPCDNMAEVREKTKDLLEGTYEIWSRKTVEPVQNALFLVKNVVSKLYDRYQGYQMEMYLTPSVGNFREQIATTLKYKGNRDAQQRPKHYKAIADYLVQDFGAQYSVNQEADDDLGIRGTVLDDAVVVSLDKDLDQIPGRHFNWVKEEEYVVSKKDGTINFYSQVLAGDPVDNIQGLTGIGPVKARKLLDTATSSKDCWQIVRDSYKGEYGEAGESRAVENARLCWVRREHGQIWQPPA
jgi:hypothetical protein